MSIQLGDPALATTRDASVAATRRPGLFRLRPGDWAVRLGAIGVFLGIWEFLAPGWNPLIIRPPSAIARAFVDLTASGELPNALWISLRSFGAGLAIAVVVGLFLGIVTGRWRSAFNALDPLISALYSVPSVALIPLIAFMFKYQGEAPRIAAVALFCVFPIVINTQQGVRNVDRGLLEVARAFNTSERRLWTDVIIPSATPFVLAGVRLAIGRGLIGMIVAEFLVGLVGLGYLIVQYGNVFRIDRMFVPIITVAVLGIVAMGFVQWLEGRVAPWLRREQ
jgi:NitT/TauT family transport system permease protein